MALKKGTYNDYFYLGKIIRTHGYKGGLKAVFDVDDTSAYQRLGLVFIEIKQSLAPFFIKEIHFENNKANIRLVDVNTIEEAGKFINCLLYLPLEMLPKLKGNKFYFHEVIGFRVIDNKHGDIGVIEKVSDLPNNALLSIKLNDKEILIPVIDEVILKVDRRKKEIDIKAPEGLIDLYLQSGKKS